MDKKQQIIRAATELFATQGYEKTSVAAICEHAKASKGAVFHHFKNKDELLRAVFIRIAQNIDDVGDIVSPINEGLPAKERLVNLLEHIFLSMADVEEKLYYLFDYQVLTQPSMRVILQDLIDERYQLMMSSFESILCDIPAADSKVDSQMLIAEISGIALYYLFAKDDYPLEAIKDRFIKKYLLLLGL
ncbi:TetR/AcrR family transcriptional regulator [Parendozoicomonas haliclonae]|uniref:HTH-type transcriptional regulator MtrR n=1 Tax=Parendozoicomonas haliclonae TaxID=1960125 RepID=A0A1X7AQ30_9GAMM|nr:TetR/AcrR family transcriptional regulator [Parendozoicomonas haliclonae]SMA50210.1 HTH-type transcriptional regulator MtrR [Parendozoicomonas haliclonae]